MLYNINRFQMLLYHFLTQAKILQIKLNCVFILPYASWRETLLDRTFPDSLQTHQVIQYMHSVFSVKWSGGLERSQAEHWQGQVSSQIRYLLKILQLLMWNNGGLFPFSALQLYVLSFTYRLYSHYALRLSLTRSIVELPGSIVRGF